LKIVINSGVGGEGIRDEVCQLVSFRQFDWDEASDCVICLLAGILIEVSHVFCRMVRTASLQLLLM
jgi:hypothetical protein